MAQLTIVIDAPEGISERTVDVSGSLHESMDQAQAQLGTDSIRSLPVVDYFELPFGFGLVTTKSTAVMTGSDGSGRMVFHFLSADIADARRQAVANRAYRQSAH